MSDVTVRPLDVLDDVEFDAAYEVLDRAERHGREHAAVIGAALLRSGLSRPTSMRVQSAWVARRGDAVVGMALAIWPLSDNTHLCWAGVAVDPDHRRIGVGSALLATVEAAVRQAGRRVPVFEVEYPVGVESWPGRAFAAAHGYEMALHEAHEILTLPVPAERLDATPRDGYRVVSWRNRCPDEWAESYCALMRSFSDEAPTGDVDMEATDWTVPRLREAEADTAARGKRFYVSAAVSPDGELVGYTEIGLPPDDDDAHQDETLVRPEHRGHGTGLAIKAANLRALQADAPERRRVHTYVSPDNGPMVAVNRALGFEPVEYCENWQRTLD